MSAPKNHTDVQAWPGESAEAFVSRVVASAPPAPPEIRAFLREVLPPLEAAKAAA